MNPLRLLSLVVLTLALVGCGEFRPIGDQYRYTHHRVQLGETLYSISFRYGYDYREVAAWNNVRPPYIIHAGDDLLILDHPADEEEMPPARPVATPKPASAPKPPSKWKPKPTKPPRSEPAPVRAVTTIRWSWPTGGRLAARFSAGAGRKGIDVEGKLGQPIRAAAEGEVVYSGNGLIGYGNLVIIKHDDAYLSAYGHNRKLLVKEGTKVKAGQVIGEMGQHPKSGSILHFEIRRNGKPVDPLLYLPNQTS